MMKTPRESDRNKGNSKPRWFPLQPNQQPAIPPSNLYSLADAARYVSRRHGSGELGTQRPEISFEDSERSASESKKSESTRSSCTPDQQGDNVMNYINQRRNQEAALNRLTSIKVSKASHALSPLAQLGHSARVRPIPFSFTAGLSPDLFAGSSTSAQRLGISGINAKEEIEKE